MINPRMFDNMSWRMAEVYGACVDKLLINLAHYFPYIEGEAPRGTFEYMTQMLANMGQVTSESVEIIAKTLGGADPALREALTTAIGEALQDAEAPLKRAAEAGLFGGKKTPPKLSPETTQAFQAYYRQSADKLNLVNTVMLESTQQAYTGAVTGVVQRISRTQGVLNKATGQVVTGVSTWNQAMRDAVNQMATIGITGFIDHGGHHWSPEAYVAMDIRTTVSNAARSAIWEQNEAYGNDLYSVSSHNGARPLCYPWQGKVISRDNVTRDVEDLNGNRIHVYAQSETSYGEPAGLFGINCGHFPYPFVDGFSVIRGEPQDPEENEKTYKESQEQRRLERELRTAKRDLAIEKARGAPEDVLRVQKDRVKHAQGKLDDFCEATGRNRRRAREYTPINATWPDRGNFTPTAPMTSTIDEAVKQTRDVHFRTFSGKADVYTMPDGTRFIFKANMNKAHQSMTPEMAATAYYKVPEAFRGLGQREIIVIDTYNPDDAYWRQKYKDFHHSYATGGDAITFYRHDYGHSRSYLVNTFSHEIGHLVDRNLGSSLSSWYSQEPEWQAAMIADKATSGLESITEYGTNSPKEDFAESVAEYVVNPDRFLKTMPERGKLLRRIVTNGGGTAW